jgi:hypothetical protein
LEDDDLDILELLEVLGDLRGQLPNLDLAEVHFLQLLHLLLVLFETVFDLTECAHSKILI